MQRDPGDTKHIIYVILCGVWAALVGMSVPLNMVVTIFLNSHADKSDRQYHAFYVATLAVAMGGFEMIPLAIKAEKPATLPKRWWHLAGGCCALPAFSVVAAGSMMGSQVVLVVQLATLLTTFFVIDVMDGRVRLREHAKVAALLVIFGGTWLESGGSKTGGMSGGFEAIVMLTLVAISGVGFALQSKCNNALAEDVGSAARASVLSACVNTLVSIPICLFIYFGLNVPVSFSLSSRYLWLAAGFQSAFYVGSMAYLPKALGFTRCYVITLVAKMVTSLVVDACGMVGEPIPLSALRVCALLAVLLGAVIFNSCGNSKDKVVDKARNYNTIDQSGAEDVRGA